MSISSELSSEIVVALMGSGEKSSQELEALGELTFLFHQTLQQLERDGEARKRHRFLRNGSRPGPDQPNRKLSS